jgi:hypothetical protein
MIRKSLFYGFLLMLSCVATLKAFEEDELKRYVLQKRAKAVVVQQQTTVPSKDVGNLLRCVGDFCRTEDMTTSYKTFISLLANHHVQQKTLLTKEDIAEQKVASASLEKALSDLWGVTGRQGLSVVGSVLRTTGGWFLVEPQESLVFLRIIGWNEKCKKNHMMLLFYHSHLCCQ